MFYANDVQTEVFKVVQFLSNLEMRSYDTETSWYKFDDFNQQIQQPIVVVESPWNQFFHCCLLSLVRYVQFLGESFDQVCQLAPAERLASATGNVVIVRRTRLVPEKLNCSRFPNKSDDHWCLLSISMAVPYEVIV